MMLWLRIPAVASLLLAVCLSISCSSKASVGGAPLTPEVCDNRVDDDHDGALDCVDADCRELSECQGKTESCVDGMDNDLDGLVDCADGECAANPICGESCDNGSDDNGDTLVDCADPVCKGIDLVCGEVCGDGVDNDNDGAVDCLDSDCVDVIPPCGGGATPDGTICTYGGTVAHACACADGNDNDSDGAADAADLQCFGPFDDDESSYATGIPGDNNGAKGSTECPFDGNSGTGNDWICCNPADPSQNVTPNGCDNVGCCEIDVNGNGTGEHVVVGAACLFAPACGSDGRHGCACSSVGDCDDNQHCVLDNDQGAGFCSTCEVCTPNPECDNSCTCGELCFAGFQQPASECGGGSTPGCAVNVTPCPGGDPDCSATANEKCVNGCCFPICPAGVTPCQISTECPTDFDYICVTGCCIQSF